MGRRKNLADDYNWLSVIGVDPGGTCGRGVGCFRPRDLDSTRDETLILRHFASGVVGGPEQRMCRELIDLFEAWPDAAIVSERFSLRTFSSDDELLSPVRINAVLGFWAAENGRPFFLQNAGDAAAAFPDHMIGSPRLWSSSKDARMGTKHMLLFIRRARMTKTIRQQMRWPVLPD
jgi:hypothetical protein